MCLVCLGSSGWYVELARRLDGVALPPVLPEVLGAKTVAWDEFGVVGEGVGAAAGIGGDVNGDGA